MNLLRSRRLNLVIASVAVAATLLLSQTAQAAAFFVNTPADGADAVVGDGACGDLTNACTLRAAIQEANALPGADVIELPAGKFALTLPGVDEDAGATGDLDIAGDLVIHGAGSALTFIDAGAIDRVVDVRAGTATFQGMTMRNGRVVNGGQTSAGAALRIADDLHVILDDVVIRDNVMSSSSGGLAIDSGGCIEGQHVRLLDNGGGPGSDFSQATVYLHGANACLRLDDSEISGNRANQAGAILSDFGAITLRRSLVSANHGGVGAIVLNFNAPTLLENVTISGNRGGFAGAILNDGGSHLSLVHCTVTGNGAEEGFTSVVGGIIDVHGGFGLVFLSNTIVSGNGPGSSADDCSAAVSVGGGNIIGDSAHCHFDAQPSDQFDVNPDLAALADNGGFTRTQLAGAAAVDHAQSPACTSTDQRGQPRPVDGDGDGVVACDVGAVEMQGDTIFANGFDSP
ncbi:MAG: right-handed parallel beta-helix repeat-containing protein [Dokdonella sp.]